ncbi:MAG: hypothetical protein KKF54_03935, partial [Candidatus Omnitrophica bacterium]|nr:hypothetical protein [Candidatus Omnitrophota bacterium]
SLHVRMENFINLTIISFALIITLLNCQYGFRTHTRNKRTIFDISLFNLYKKEPSFILIYVDRWQVE